MFHRLPLLLATVLLCGIVQAEHQFGPAPSWVKPFQYQTNDASPQPGQTVRYLLVDEQRRVTDTGNEWFFHYCSQPLNQIGVSEVSEIIISYKPEYEQVILHELTVIREGEASSRLEGAKILDVSREAEANRSIYTGERSISVVVDDMRVGDILKYSYSVRGANPVFDGAIFGITRIGWSVPVDLHAFRLLVPEQTKLQTRTHNVELKPAVASVDGYDEYLWSQQQLSAYEDEDYRAPWNFHYPFVEYSQFDSWRQIDRWASALFAEPGDWQLPRHLNKKVAGLSKAEDKIRSLLRFVQDDIRYISLSIGENSHRPHVPGQVIANRYGDCKDKSWLLVELLRSVGVEADVALVSTSITSGIRQLLPSPGIFNHAIVRARVGENHVWLDPTDNYQRGALENMGFNDYGVALIVGGKGGELEEMKPLPGQSDSVKLEENYRAADFSGTVELEVISHYYGAYADYYRYETAAKTIRELQNNYLNFMSAYYPNIDVAGKLKVLDDEEKNRLTVVEKYRIGDFWERTGQGNKLAGYFYTLTAKDYLRKPNVRFRETPLYLGRAKSLRHRMTFHMPSDIGLVLDSTPVVYEAAGIKNSSHWDYRNNAVTVETTLDTKAIEIAPAQLKDYLSAVGKIENSFSYQIEFGDPAQKESLLSRFKSRLRELGAESGSAP